MKGLFLHGVNCTSSIWSQVREYLAGIDADYVEYPHAVTAVANCVSDVTNWVFGEFGSSHYDFVVGHSMGGIIALELVARFNLEFRQIILVDCSLKPANRFYRNLMTEKHMEEYGGTVMQMIQEETPYYQDGLKQSLKEGFDYTQYLKALNQNVYAIYGDRGQKNYPGRVDDLCLDEETLGKIKLLFVENSCHLPMIENPSALAGMISDIVHGRLVLE
ncbi:MAG TPA: alpha/beta hydrolase [Caldisericia bacterium]|jgi:pimeloyl-ACP methyl ester carboxylesterase|nr:MAG: Alpha/beta hydrolase family protein [bacterium ADurb.Bin132]HNY60627.1 alpha/beta hydrolase [Caldisericia bacterium]HOC79667.1 alpha/beta hydrolase [Caldisericia bacterium]HOG70047.1 alpha/beta hydrolase [Caldisericia bacterium]HPA65015.1 alpha/beta hydrolase [Caldisericia bacterium]